MYFCTRLREPLALEKCASGLLTLQNLLPRNGELGLADIQTLSCAICPSRSAYLSNPWPPVLHIAHHLCNIKSPETSFSDCKIILKNALFCSTGHILLGSPAHCSGGKPSRPASLPGSSRRAPLHPGTPGKELDGRHGTVLSSLSAPSVKALCGGSPWFFSVLSRLPALLFQAAD